jgi:hypothetical protein
MEELLEKIPVEKRWGITAKILTRLVMLRGSKTIAPLLGKGEGIISPVLGWEKYNEITDKIWGAGGRMRYPKIRDAFNIPVGDAIGAVKLHIVAGTLAGGPETKYEIFEANPEKVIVRRQKCVWWERYSEFNVDPELTLCDAGCQAYAEEGFKAVNPKITNKLTKAMPRGEPYCEFVIKFKDE